MLTLYLKCVLSISKIRRNQLLQKLVLCQHGNLSLLNYCVFSYLQHFPTTGWCDNVHTNQQTTIRSVRTTSPDIKRFCCIYDPKNSANRWTDLVIFFRNSSNRHWKISSILEKENLYKSEAEFKKLYVYKYFDKF